MKINLSLPPFNFEVSTNIAHVKTNIQALYPEQSLSESSFTDYRLSLENTGLFRQFFKKQSRFLCDYREPFKPLNYSQAFAMLEWGMNWTVASHEMSYLMVHSAVLAKNGKAILFPAPPGSGKSTITAFLAFNGWQLLSDEMALINLESGKCQPFVRPICLKNSSIDMVSNWFPDASYSSVAKDTHKGDVIHMSPPSQSWAMRNEEAEVVGIVYPQYTKDAMLTIEPLSQASSFIQLTDNAFNFTVLGRQGFDALTKLVERAQSFKVWHSDLSELSDFLEEEVL